MQIVVKFEVRISKVNVKNGFVVNDHYSTTSIESQDAFRYLIFFFFFEVVPVVKPAP